MHAHDHGGICGHHVITLPGRIGTRAAGVGWGELSALTTSHRHFRRIKEIATHLRSARMVPSRLQFLRASLFGSGQAACARLVWAIPGSFCLPSLSGRAASTQPCDSRPTQTPVPQLSVVVLATQEQLSRRTRNTGILESPVWSCSAETALLGDSGKPNACLPGIVSLCTILSPSHPPATRLPPAAPGNLATLHSERGRAGHGSIQPPNQAAPATSTARSPGSTHVPYVTPGRPRAQQLSTVALAL